MLTEAQLEIRRTRIGASEVAALLGVDPHKTPLDLFTERVCPTPRETEPHQSWGLDVERPILEHWARAQGLRLTFTGDKTLSNEKAPHLCATPDAVAILGGGRFSVADAKNVQRHNPSRLQWGEPGTGEVPTHYAAQLVVSIGLAEMTRPGAFESRGHLVASIEGAPPEAWPVDYDPDLFGFLHDKAEKFIRDHVLTGKPPENWERDRSALEYVAARYRKATAPLRPASAEAVALAASLRTMDATVKAATEERDAVKALLLAEIGEAAGIDGIAKWTQVEEKREQTHDFRAIALQLLDEMGLKPAALDEMLPRFTVERVARKSYRRLTLTKLSKED